MDVDLFFDERQEGVAKWALISLERPKAREAEGGIQKRETCGAPGCRAQVALWGLLVSTGGSDSWRLRRFAGVGLHYKSGDIGSLA